MTAFAGQQWPTPSAPGPVIGATVILLTITVVIVTMPRRTVRRASLQEGVDYLYLIDNQRIIGAA